MFSAAASTRKKLSLVEKLRLRGLPTDGHRRCVEVPPREPTASSSAAMGLEQNLSRNKGMVLQALSNDAVVQRILESPYAGPEFSLVWHAGEPLTLPTSWYDQATFILQRSLAELALQVVVLVFCRRTRRRRPG